MQNHDHLCCHKPISVFPVTLIYSTAVFGQPLFRTLAFQNIIAPRNGFDFVIKKPFEIKSILWWVWLTTLLHALGALTSWNSPILWHFRVPFFVYNYVGMFVLAILYFRMPYETFFLPPQILHKLLFSNALGDITFSQEHLKTIVYAKFWGANIVYYGTLENREWVVPTLWHF